MRRVQSAPGASFTVADSPEGWFRGQLVPPDDDLGAADDASPRTRPPYTVRWLGGTIGAGARAPARPSERVESGSLTVELLSLPRRVQAAGRALGVEVTAQDVQVLYPFHGALQEQGGQAVLPDVPLATWSPDEARTDRGQYLLYQAESPAEFAAALTVKNRQIVLNGTPFRIVDPVLIIQAPRVRYVLRGAK